MNQQQPMTLDMDFNAQMYEPAGVFEAIPGADYSAFIKKVELVPYSSGDPGMRFVVTWQVTEGQFAKRTVFQGFNIQHQTPVTVEIAMKELSQLCHAVNRLQFTFRDGGIALLNATAIIGVTNKEGRNNVKFVKALVGNAQAPQMTAAPQTPQLAAGPHTPQTPPQQTQPPQQLQQQPAPQIQQQMQPQPQTQQWNGGQAVDAAGAAPQAPPQNTQPQQMQQGQQQQDTAIPWGQPQ